MQDRFERRTVTEGVDAHVCGTTRFKSLALRVRLLEPLDEHASARTLISGLLRRGCRGAPDLRSIAMRFEDLYGAGVALGASRCAEEQASDFTLRMVHPRFAGEPGALREALSFLYSLIAEPVLEDGAFRAVEFEQERRNLERSIRALDDDPYERSQRTYIAAMFEGEPYARTDHGEIADLARLDARAVYDFHVARLAAAPLALYAIGAFDAADQAAIDEFGARFGSRARAPSRSVKVRVPAARRRIVHRGASVESHLFIGYRFDPRADSPRDALAQAIAVTLLGGGATSLLFREVRERERLCYSTHAQMDRSKGFVSLYAGVEAREDAVERAEATMLAQVARLRNGDFDDDSIASARASMARAFDTVFDSPFSAIEFVARTIYAGWEPDQGAFRRLVDAVTRDEVIAAAERWVRDLTFVSHGSEGDSGEK
jgi:predicted Zn-dependent peptidase